MATEPQLHPYFKCPRCGKEWGEATNLAQGEKICPECAARVSSEGWTPSKGLAMPAASRAETEAAESKKKAEEEAKAAEESKKTGHATTHSHPPKKK